MFKKVCPPLDLDWQKIQDGTHAENASKNKTKNSAHVFGRAQINTKNTYLNE